MQQNTTAMLPAILAAIPSLFQGAQGLIQMIGGKKQMDQAVRPEYKMPDEINSMLTLAQAQYQDPYSTQNLNAQRSIGMGAANAVMAGRDSGNLAAILPAIVGSQNQGYNQAAQMQEATKARERAQLTDMLGIKAKYQDQEWQMNKYSPFVDNMNEGRERYGAGTQNLFGGLNGLSSIGQMLFSRNQNNVAPGDAAQFTSQQSNQSSMLNGLIQGYASNSMLPTTDMQSYQGQNGIQNRAANQFWWSMNTLGRNF